MGLGILPSRDHAEAVPQIVKPKAADAQRRRRASYPWRRRALPVLRRRQEGDDLRARPRARVVEVGSEPCPNCN